ncbi:MAG TPA: winged helix-turn-helix domain-containing protein [Methylomirabilota bacterium]|nr:winged helix-turn-helix domain-containing protein [Methylomirabilota bacterium]
MMQSAISSSSFERKKSKSNGGTNRGKIQITADILCLSTVAIKKTHIMYKANLSYEQVNYYLSDMLNNDLISQHILEDGIVYRTSEKGREYLKHYTRLMDLVMERQNENQKEQTQDARSKEQKYILQY